MVYWKISVHGNLHVILLHYGDCEEVMDHSVKVNWVVKVRQVNLDVQRAI